MAYTDLTALKAHLGITGSADDSLLAAAIAAAQQAIDAEMGRRFEAANQTRYYGPGAVEGQLLQLDEDLLSVTTLTNGDGSVLASSEYVLFPRNSTPAWAIRLKSTSAWQFSADGEIAVAGIWGFTATAGANVAHACLRVAAYLYRGKDQQNFEVTRQPDGRFGGLSVPPGMLRELTELLRGYRKRSF